MSFAVFLYLILYKLYELYELDELFYTSKFFTLLA